MAAATSLRVPFRASVGYCGLGSFKSVRLAPQLQARLPRNIQKSSRRRNFVTSAALQEKKYTKDHEWVELSEDGKIGTMGVSVYAAKNLGDVVYVELPTLDEEFKAGDTIGAVESVKSASDILAPISGKVKEVNNKLGEKPGNINKEPEGEAWIAKIEVEDAKEMDDLMGDVEYGQFTAE